MNRENDLQITRIHTVFNEKTTNWARTESTPRYSNGFSYIIEGDIRYFFDGCEFVSHKGDLLYFPKGSVYQGNSLSKINHFIHIDFDLADESAEPILPLQISNVPMTFEHGFYKALEYWKSDLPTGMLKCRSEIYSLLASACELIDRTPYMGREYTNKAVEFIQKNFGNPLLYIKQIADSVNISESHLRRVFLETLKQTPKEYLQHYRLEHAKQLLMYSSSSLTEISEASGYSSQFYFCKVFKRNTGLTPTEFRMKQRRGL